jgi:hypothetical protein
MAKVTKMRVFRNYLFGVCIFIQIAAASELRMLIDQRVGSDSVSSVLTQFSEMDPSPFEGLGVTFFGGRFAAVFRTRYALCLGAIPHTENI